MEKVSRRYFEKLIPFNVIEQSNRSCLCATCYKAKLATIALHELWPTLHQGPTPGSGCTCDCELCKDGGCADYLPYESRKEIFGMGKFSDKHMCEKESLYTSRDGTLVEAHRSICVSGHCVECKRKQAVFFGCPRHKGGLQRLLHTTRSSVTSTSGGSPPGEIRWNMYTEVDENGQATTKARATNRRQRGREDGDAEYDPRAGSRTKNRQVWIERIA